MKYIKWFGILVLALIFISGFAYLMGPQPEFEKVDPSPIHFNFDIKGIDSFIVASNSSEPTLKADNGSQIYWNDSTETKTPYSLLFLHGFSGTHHEANPLHKDFGKRYGMNTYLHRIIDHGISDRDAFKDLTPRDFLNSAKEGLAIAKLIGEKVVIMSCSTGGTYTAYLAQNDDDISHLIYLSPNIEIYTPASKLTTGPWGEALIEMTVGGKHRKVRQSPEAAAFWQTEYHVDGLVALQGLIDQTMTTDVFQAIEQPSFIGCYYKDDEHQDFVVSVDAMRTFYDDLGTNEVDKVFKEFPNARNHVIGSPLKAQAVDEVYEAVYEFGDRYFSKVN